jgi:hypothetical protein
VAQLAFAGKSARRERARAPRRSRSDHAGALRERA